MKQIIKYLFLFMVTIIVIIFLLYFTVQYNVKNNLEDKQNSVNESWTELFNRSNDRVLLIKKIILENSNRDSLNFLIDKNIIIRNQNRDECSVDFVEQEYIVNEMLLKNLRKYAENKKLINNDYELNKLVSKYNDDVYSYNMYKTTFPNFIIAKKYRFFDKKYFTIKYGVKNEDPVIKNKKIPEWMTRIEKEHGLIE